MRASAVRVTAPARLHLGFLDLEGGLGRRFGSLGLTIEGFATSVTLAAAQADAVTGSAEGERARRALSVLRSAWNLPPVRVAVDGTIPAHAGLGSGTQLGLALGVGLARLTGRAAGAREVARLLERGARSGIGIGAFEQGGFILDGGRSPEGDPPPVTARLPFPSPWRLLLILDQAREGLHGSGELGAFRALPPYSTELAGHLCRLVVMQLLPGLATADIEAVGAAIGEIQRRVGDYFAPAQGGRFTSPAVSEILAWLEAQGIAGVGQSSWGPTGFAILDGVEHADALRRAAKNRFGQRFPSLRFLVVQGRNEGARIVVEP
jgi:beta-ribofuranosylaminobenzene 5'-phosphate synthase